MYVGLGFLGFRNGCVGFMIAFIDWGQGGGGGGYVVLLHRFSLVPRIWGVDLSSFFFWGGGGVGWVQTLSWFGFGV